jgi:light-regulated signal transduction histidine kinase (bacteriophytochrome)
MGVLIDGLMELTRLGTAELQLAPVPLLPLVQDVLAELQSQVPQRQITWQLPSDLPAVRADANVLRTALLAVLDNAVKFTGRKPNAQISIHAVSLDTERAGSKTGPVVKLTVQDNGAGFNPALGAKLFHAFARLHTIKQFPGIGMGLALVRKSLARMDGTVQADGVIDGGCTVTMTLPAADSS